jgi:hypothetical protein
MLAPEGGGFFVGLKGIGKLAQVIACARRRVVSYLKLKRCKKDTRCKHAPGKGNPKGGYHYRATIFGNSTPTRERSPRPIK